MNDVEIANRLTRVMENLLVSHIDGPVTVREGETPTTRIALIRLGLIKPDRDHRPHHTMITERGRAVMAYVLGRYADVLSRVALMRAEKAARNPESELASVMQRPVPIREDEPVEA